MHAPSHPNQNLTQLRRLLVQFFDAGELRTLCFDLAVDYEYDEMGRLVTVDPEAVHGGARIDYDYTVYTVSNPATVEVVKRPNGDAVNVLAREKYLYDGLGQLTTEKKLLASFTLHEDRLDEHDSQLEEIIETIREMQQPRRPIGFRVEEVHE